MSKKVKIDNRTARRLWLSVNGLATTPTGPLDLLSVIRQLGFVQLDTIQVVSRAHHHILWSRNQNYREPMLNKLMSQDRAIFEHFTHDASVLPMEFLPMWQRQFQRKKNLIDRSNWYQTMPDEKGRYEIRKRIEQDGPLSTHAFNTKVSDKGKMWRRPPHKLALDYMWYCGELATSHRVNFTKFYDLAENVFPKNLATQKINDREQVDWLCRAAMDRLGFASIREVQKFWDAVDLGEVKEWIADNNEIIPVKVQSMDGSWTDSFATSTIEEWLDKLAKPTSRLRILNPFDPAIRDRIRLQRLFGFHYRVEMFVPAAKRQWGYYVYPLLEEARFVGRIEVKADRGKNALNIMQFWPENGVKWDKKRMEKLHSELERMARFASVETINWHCQVGQVN